MKRFIILILSLLPVLMIGCKEEEDDEFRGEVVCGNDYDVYLDSDGIWKKKTYMDIGSGVKKFVVFEETETQVFATMKDTIIDLDWRCNRETLRETNPWIWKILGRINPRAHKEIFIYSNSWDGVKFDDPVYSRVVINPEFRIKELRNKSYKELCERCLLGLGY